MKTYILIFLSIVLSDAIVLGQNGHYWTQQYGTKSMLLSGSPIGGVEDLGAVFYNPARLGHIENPAFLLSADVYELNKIKVEDGFGNDANVSKSEFGGVPSLAAGTFKIKKLKNHHFAYAILVRQNSSMDFTYKNEVYGNVIEAFPGEEYFGAETTYKAKENEEWMGFSWSYPFNNKVSVGISSFLSTKDYMKNMIVQLQALSSENDVALYKLNKEYKVNYYSLHWKLGLALNINNSLLGLTILTPSIKIKGEGEYKYEEFLAGIEGIVQDDKYITSDQDGLKPKFCNPWAIGMGWSFPLNKSKLHISTEYYMKISKYTVMKAEDHLGQSNNDVYSFRFVDSRKSVWNAGIGLELYLTDKISGFGSVSTDFSAINDGISKFIDLEGEVHNGSLKADFYHLGGGIVLHLNGADLTLGTTHTGAKQKFSRPVDFPEEGDDNIFERDENALLKWERWRFVFSFSFPFLKDLGKKNNAPEESNN